MSTTSSLFKVTADPISGPRRRAIEAIAASINLRGTPLNATDIASAKQQLHPWSEQKIRDALEPRINVPPVLAEVDAIFSGSPNIQNDSDHLQQIRLSRLTEDHLRLNAGREMRAEEARQKADEERRKEMQELAVRERSLREAEKREADERAAELLEAQRAQAKRDFELLEAQRAQDKKDAELLEEQRDAEREVEREIERRHLEQSEITYREEMVLEKQTHEEELDLDDPIYSQANQDETAGISAELPMPGHLGPIVNLFQDGGVSNTQSLDDGFDVVRSSIGGSSWQELAVFFEGLGVEGTQDMLNLLYKGTTKDKNKRKTFKPDDSLPLLDQFKRWKEQRDVMKREAKKKQSRRGTRVQTSQVPAGGFLGDLSLRSRRVQRY